MRSSLVVAASNSGCVLLREMERTNDLLSPVTRVHPPHPVSG